LERDGGWASSHSPGSFYGNCRLLGDGGWPSRAWLGVSIETADYWGMEVGQAELGSEFLSKLHNVVEGRRLGELALAWQFLWKLQIIGGRRLAKQSLARSFYRNSTMLLRGGGWASYRSLAKQSLAWQKRAIIEEHRGGF